MATAHSIAPLIYHEKQQSGSMLCAQHALNSLLQGNYFSAPDLSDIARSLDELEERYNEDNRGSTSSNMDDTGFFSVQVLEKALQVWGLTLVRWRSEVMRPYQEHPQTQLAFILNYQQHWYTLRRFGAVSTDPSPESNPSDGIWFNLNSFLPVPERVGSTYLGMVLQQAEAEGYSVFAVVQIDPEAPLALPRNEADEVAASLAVAYDLSSTGGGDRGEEDIQHSGFEDEDMDMQAALQASLMYNPSGQETAHASTSNSSNTGAQFAPSVSANTFNNPFRTVDTNSGIRTPTQRTRPGYSILSVPHRGGDDLNDDLNEDDDEFVDASDYYPPTLSAAEHYAASGPVPAPTSLDPVEASRRRNQALMEHMMRQQEFAMRETVQEEEARVRAGLQQRRRTHQDEEDELERAIRASMTEARERGGGPSEQGEVDEEDMPLVDEPESTVRTVGTATQDAHRVYDDDDAELQAALKASLETVPDGFRIPSTPPRPILHVPTTLPPSIPPPPTTMPTLASITTVGNGEEAEGDTESEAGSSVVEEAPTLDVDEMRKRRLARFGG